MTVAMWLACSGMQIPRQWYHDPTLQNTYGGNVAAQIREEGQEVPRFWNLDKSEFERLYKSK